MHLFANIKLSLQAPVLVLLYPSTAPLPQNTLQNHAPTWRKNHHFLHCFCIFHLYPEPYAQCLYTHLTQGKTPKIVQRKNFSYGNSKSSKRYTNATTWLGTFEY